MMTGDRLGAPIRVLGRFRAPIQMAPVLALFVGCGNTSLDAGFDHPHGPLPVDERNPIVVVNDGPRDNWQGEYAMALASAGQLSLVGIVVNTSPEYASLDVNVQGWQAMAQAARDSNMSNIPDPTPSASSPLVRPADGTIESTQPNLSDGARFIVDSAHRLSLPNRPLVIATGGRLTDVADAYLMDRAMADLIVVVASLGHPSPDGQGAMMNDPNGNLDTWADEIVARRLRYVQINAYYAQKNDVPATRVGELPANAFGTWMSSKLNDILALPEAADQNSVIASALTGFSLDVEQVAESGASAPPPQEAPLLGRVGAGRAWLVSRGNNAAATDRFWQVLKSPATYGH